MWHKIATKTSIILLINMFNLDYKGKNTKMKANDKLN